MCWQNEDAGRIIICDECEEEFHTYCLQPPLEDVPEGGDGESCWLPSWCTCCQVLCCLPGIPGLQILLFAL